MIRSLSVAPGAIPLCTERRALTTIPMAKTLVISMSLIIIVVPFDNGNFYY